MGNTTAKPPRAGRSEPNKRTLAAEQGIWDVVEKTGFNPFEELLKLACAKDIKAQMAELVENSKVIHPDDLPKVAGAMRQLAEQLENTERICFKLLPYLYPRKGEITQQADEGEGGGSRRITVVVE